MAEMIKKIKLWGRGISKIKANSVNDEESKKPKKMIIILIQKSEDLRESHMPQWSYIVFTFSLKTTPRVL